MVASTPPLEITKLKIEIAIDNIPYHLIAHAQNFIDPSWFPTPSADFVPVTVISCPPDTPCTPDFLTSFRANLDKDDVWTSSYLQRVVIYSAQTLDPAVRPLLSSWNVTTCKHINSTASPPSGPYVLALSRTWQPWRVYPDSSQTMMLAFRPAPAGVYEEYGSAYTTGGTSVLVPSRAYFSPTPSRPLSGLRFAVKDMFDVAHHPTSCGSRAYAELSGPATQTAPCIQRLLDLGAILVGKLKLATFVIRELPGENFDFAPPWNPRGDGYLTPGESSSGSGAAIVSYDWLDMTVASDTTGSSRVPVYFDGCHGIRFTTDVMPKAGVLGFYPRYDTQALFTRSIDSLTTITRAWLASSSQLTINGTPPKPFNSVLVPKDYTDKLDAKSLSQLMRLATTVAAILGVTVTHMSLAERWDIERPAGENHGPLEPWIKDVAAVPYVWDAVDGYKSFVENYGAKFSRKPYLNREMLWRWEHVKSYTKHDRETLFARLQLYKRWLLSSIFAATDSGSQDDTTTEHQPSHSGNLIIYPVDTCGPVYRDNLSGDKVMCHGIDAMNISPITGGAEVSVVVGDTPYESRVSGNEERMPFAVSVIGQPGCDVQLLEVVSKAMNRAGLPSEVATGKSIYFKK